MGFVESLIKRVERRGMRELENATTKKLKDLLFGEKTIKVSVSKLVEYWRTELRLRDLMGNPKSDKKEILELVRNLKKIYGELLSTEQWSDHNAFCLEVERL